MSSPLLNQAIQFAAQAHRNQLRKGTDLPYIVHPFAVGMILSQFRFSEPVIAAGLLHDTLEDTGVTELALAAEFGAEIATIVAGCSEPDKSLPWRERKQHTVDAMRSAPWPVKAVAAADKLDNLRAMAADFARIGDALWQRFKQGREEQEWYYRAVFQALVGIPAGAPEAYRQLLGELDDALEHHFQRARCSRVVAVDRREAERCRDDTIDGRCGWLLAIDSEKLAARFVQRNASGFVADAQGHEDFFPMAMLFEQDDGFLEGGDWVTVGTPNLRPHDGSYRSYRISWK
jgi:HD domain